MVNSGGVVLQKTGHDRGTIHEYEILNKQPTTPLQVENILDLGYLGVKDFPTAKYVLPFRN